MLNIVPKLQKSKAKLGKAAWCVDTRYVMASGSRHFFFQLSKMHCASLIS